MNIKQALLIFWSRRITITAVFLAIMIAAVVGLQMVQPQYQARAQVFVNLSDANAATLNQISIGGSRTYVNSQVEALRSRGTAVAVVRTLGLDSDPEMIEAFRNSGERGQIADWISARVQRGLEGNRQGLSDIISISYRSANAETAARFANTFASALIQREVQMRIQPAIESVRLHEERLKVLRERFAEVEVDRSRLRLDAIRRGDVDASGQIDPNASVSTILANARNSVIQARTALDLARSGQNPPADNPEMVSLRRSLAEIDVAIQRETPLLGPGHRRIQALTANAAQFRNQINNVSNRLKAELLADREREVLAAERRVQEAQTLLTQDESQRNDQSRSRSQAASLDRELEALKAQIDTLVQRRERASAESVATVSNLSILTSAVTPSDPAWPRASVVLGAALAIGAALGFAVAFLREMLDRRVRCVDDLTAYIDAPVLGEIGRMRFGRGMTNVPESTGRGSGSAQLRRALPEIAATPAPVQV